MGFGFWQKWLVVVGLYHVVFGLVLALFVQSDFMDVYFKQYFDVIFWPDSNISPAAEQYKNWTSSVLGSVVASWGVFITYIAWYPFRLRETWAWHGILVPVTLWFVVDTTCSIYYGVGINALFNIITLLLFVLPLSMTWKYFFAYRSL